jgi:protein-S-isoprenylcysteine O-methyltransferase Ste14
MDSYGFLVRKIISIKKPKECKMTEKPQFDNKLDQPFPLWFVLLIPVYVAIALGIFVFPIAGDWRWVAGWIFLLSFTVNISISYGIINKKNPRVLRNRAKMKKIGLTRDTRKPASSDRFIYPMMAVGYFGSMVLAALNHRWGWYELPLPIILIAAFMMNVGVGILNLATFQNSFASKVLDIRQEQVLVDSGMYAHVRHPLYAGGILMALFIPLALGSLWGLIPAFFAAAALVIRIEFEEEMLLKGMDGYADYQQRVKYKLIPGIY